VSEHRQFHYRLPQRIGGWRPGSHRGSSLGAGQEFVSHMRLYDRPDPRRLDLRASLRNIQQEWLVRVNRQQASIPVHAVVDVSASMGFGSRRRKLDVAAEFIEALGQSTFKVGDALGMLAFDSRERTDLFVPAMVSRGMGDTMAKLLRTCSGKAGDAAGLQDAIQHLAGRRGLVFLRKLSPQPTMVWRSFATWNRAHNAPCGCDRACAKNGGNQPMRGAES
jgi:uncharacterized protein (DUF58 family)